MVNRRLKKRSTFISGRPAVVCILLSLGFAVSQPLGLNASEQAASAEGPDALVGVTTLSDPSLAYNTPPSGRLTLSHGPITMVVADNRAFGPTHRAGYNGVAELRHKQREANLFVPAYAGLNLEHIHDGSSRLVDRDIYFEPRSYPMQLRRIGEHTAELYQPPTPTWKVESCTRFELLHGGVIEMTFHARPTQAVFKHDYLGFFWASYIDRPESKAIHFRGVREPGSSVDWIEAFSATHGEHSTHLALADDRVFTRDSVFPDRSLIFAFSRYRYDEPFYYGVSHGMALVYIFRPTDQIRMTQSPTGGGAMNPAWDFQWFIAKPAIGQIYGMRMRAAYVPFTSRQDIATLARKHLSALSN